MVRKGFQKAQKTIENERVSLGVERAKALARAAAGVIPRCWFFLAGVLTA